jgi:hypothetical protein
VRSSLSTDAPTDASDAVTAARASAVRRAASVEDGDDMFIHFCQSLTKGIVLM